MIKKIIFSFALVSSLYACSDDDDLKDGGVIDAEAPKVTLTSQIEGFEYTLESQPKFGIKIEDNTAIKSVVVKAFDAENKEVEIIKSMTPAITGNKFEGEISLNLVDNAAFGEYTLKVLCSDSVDNEVEKELGKIALIDRYFANGDFETWGEQEVQIYEKSGGENIWDADTSYVKGGVLTESELIQALDRPLGFNIMEDLYNAQVENKFCIQTSDAHSGSSAIHLKTAPPSFFGTGQGEVGIVGLFKPETLRWEACPTEWNGGIPAAIEGYYKHKAGGVYTVPAGMRGPKGIVDEEYTVDPNMRVYAYFFKKNSEGGFEKIATADQELAAVNEYTKFSVPVTIHVPDVEPDYITFVISSSPSFIAPNLVCNNGSESHVDDVEFVYTNGRKSAN